MGRAKQPKPCQIDGCSYPKKPGRHRCVWHFLLAQPIEEQVAAADARRARWSGEERARVPKAEWPSGERWCGGCQSFVPIFYTSGSRCRACQSRAQHASAIQREYGISGEVYEALLEWQQGRCYFCRRVPRVRRLAVDHDHATGFVRGLLCADDERGCNHAILGNIADLDMARRIVQYLERSPMERLQAGEPLPELAYREPPNRDPHAHWFAMPKKIPPATATE